MKKAVVWYFKIMSILELALLGIIGFDIFHYLVSGSFVVFLPLNAAPLTDSEALDYMCNYLSTFHSFATCLVFLIPVMAYTILLNAFGAIALVLYKT